MTRNLHVLDLLDNGSMRAGIVAAISKCGHDASQPWSRCFYERNDLYGLVDGLCYRNAHNDQPAIVLFERSRACLDCDEAAILRLDDQRLRASLIEAMIANNLVF